MNERENKGNTEESQTPRNIGISYNGVLAEKMDWRRDTLARLEQVSYLSTSTTITSRAEREDHEVVSLGDTLAVKKLSSFEELFARRKSQNRFLSVETNLSTGRAIISIDDQALASNVLSRHTKFDENLYVEGVNSLVKDGLRSVVTAEKKRQVIISAQIDTWTGVGFATLLPGEVYFLSHMGLDIDNYINMVLGVSGVLLGATINRSILTGLMEKTTKRKLLETNPRYFERTSDLFNLPKHLGGMRNGRKFLSNPNNSVVNLKSSTPGGI